MGCAMTKTTIKEQVNVTAVWFDRELGSVPKRIEFGGRSYTFVDRGLRYCIRRGTAVTRLFDLTDGESLFRLRHEVDADAWNLLSISR